MTSGRMMLKHNRILLLLLYFPISLNPLICSANTELEKLLFPFTKISSIHFSYTEIRTSFFFKKAQISSGEIQFIQPDIIIKQVLNPENIRYEINNNSLTIYQTKNSSNSKTGTQLNIEDYPQLKQFIDLLKALLSGDAQFLRENYKITIAHKESSNQAKGDWELKLVPINLNKNIELEQKHLQSISIRTLEQHIKSIKMLGYGGEISELKIEQILNLKSN
ncbi:MAG: hypothetical protein QM479_04400 [Pseudomonadota bacterium]